MVLISGPPNQDQRSSFLQPGLPILLFGAQVASNIRTARSRAAVADLRADLTGGRSEGTSSTGSSQSTGNSRHASSSGPSTTSWRITLPTPTFTGAFFGLGAGGAAFIGNPGKAQAVWPFRRAPKAVAKEDKGRKRILIMMSQTGGGHKASAEALRDAFVEKYGDAYHIDIVDMWKEHTPPPFKHMPDSYSFLVKHSILWRLSYEITQPKWFHIPYFLFCGLFMRNGLNRAFDIYNPDLVVSVHPLMQHVPIRILKHRIKTGRMHPCNFATVITDFTTCHNSWFHTSATRCFVPTEYCAMLARDNGLDDEQIVMHGLPIRPLFSKAVASKKELRKQLGIDQHLPTVLLVGGGEGMGKLEETVDQLDQQLGSKAQVVVICGRNQKLLNRLGDKQLPGGLQVHARGFVNNMHEWMCACDAIITKAGPGTIAEALICGLPILLNGNVPCQEEGNIPWVIDNGVGDFETHPPKIAHIMHRWLLPEDEAGRHHMQHMRARAKELGRPEAVYQIVQDLAHLADKPDFNYGPAVVAAPASRSTTGAWGRTGGGAPAMVKA